VPSKLSDGGKRQKELVMVSFPVDTAGKLSDVTKVLRDDFVAWLDWGFRK
jgi:hypothetical protein